MSFEVTEREGRTTLVAPDGKRHSVLGDFPTGAVWDMMALGWYGLRPTGTRALTNLFLGVGGGTVPRMFRWLAGPSIDTSEFYGVDHWDIITLADNEMALFEIKWREIYCNGVAEFLAVYPTLEPAWPTQFSYVVEDLFGEEGKPEELRPSHYLKMMDLVEPAGVYIGNVQVPYAPGYRRLVTSKFKRVIQVEHKDLHNVVFIATDVPLTPEILMGRVARHGRIDLAPLHLSDARSRRLYRHAL